MTPPWFLGKRGNPGGNNLLGQNPGPGGQRGLHRIQSRGSSRTEANSVRWFPPPSTGEKEMPGSHPEEHAQRRSLRCHAGNLHPTRSVQVPSREQTGHHDGAQPGRWIRSNPPHGNGWGEFWLRTHLNTHYENKLQLGQVNPTGADTDGDTIQWVMIHTHAGPELKIYLFQWSTWWPESPVGKLPPWNFGPEDQTESVPQCLRGRRRTPRTSPWGIPRCYRGCGLDVVFHLIGPRLGLQYR